MFGVFGSKGDRIKVSRDLQLFVGGLVALMGSIIFSLFVLSRLDKSFHDSQASFKELDAINEFEKVIKDKMLFDQMSRIGEATELKNRKRVTMRDVTFQSDHLITSFRFSSSELRGIMDVVNDLETIDSGRNEYSHETVSRVDSLFKFLREKRERNAIFHSGVIVERIDRSIAASIFSAFISILIIVTAIKERYRENLRRLNMINNLNSLKEAAESASLLKSKFLSTVSHEIRTPLNGIIGLSNVLLESELESSKKDLIAAIHQSGKTLLKIISDILDFSKFETGKIELNETYFSIHEVLNQILTTLSSKAAEKSLELEYEIGESVPKQVFGDPDRITQVLFNLVGNAIKFTDRGRIFIEVKALDPNRRPGHLKFSVQDTGIGISKENLSSLFQPFTQVSKAGTSGEPGTGLGLSISQSIINALGSRIRVTSTQGEGSNFFFDLEFDGFSKETYGRLVSYRDVRDDTPSKLSSLGSLNLDYSPHILLVEDNVTNQIVVQSMVTRLGCRWTSAAHGREAIEILERNVPDLIIMDCQMPVMDGYEATRIIRSKGISLPIIAMTANVSKSDEDLCLQAGMTDYIPKPIEPLVLKEKMLKYLPRVPTLNVDVLMKLESSLGRDDRRKVVQAFLSTTGAFRRVFEKNERVEELREIRRLGHRFKGSSLIVGGIQFSDLCSKLEKIENLDAADEIGADACQSLARLEQALYPYSIN